MSFANFRMALLCMCWILKHHDLRTPVLIRPKLDYFQILVPMVSCFGRIQLGQGALNVNSDLSPASLVPSINRALRASEYSHKSGAITALLSQKAKKQKPSKSRNLDCATFTYSSARQAPQVFVTFGRFSVLGSKAVTSLSCTG